MIVEQIMTKDVITLTQDDSIKSAHQLMREHTIRHLPLINQKDEIIGLVTERDIKDATPASWDDGRLQEIMKMPLSSIMKTNLITGHPLDFVEEVAVLFYDHKIGCLPIINRGKLVGIITGTDLLHTMVELTGANKPGSQIEIQVENRPGILYEVTGIFCKQNINVHSVLVYPDPDNEKYKILVFRVATMNPIKVIDQLKKEGLHVQWPNIPGMSL
ncbi:acetoin utilization AcuB family protein [Lederbergia citrea]|uniref:Acetoin utilization AcuB family protein n=1 Tax=Lederbergia citrea TaxID=2833581 RepID=A0A942URN8_9BACI|nr:acetoin utilization AcuB family protein [Lederbergia citrea]MBS4176004.1 acetoin utilization AcuB family protein [Lederbergia citrea]MBS4202565.1 acetoin utilization AcuB family protein [Lederbergia citrea]MBS4222769.1 acetoin utilization AcuB family protein [Lederbergia citrea]